MRQFTVAGHLATAPDIITPDWAVLHVDTADEHCIPISFCGQQAEAMSLGKKQRHVALRQLVLEHRRELDNRWQRNMVLNKWLDYLSDKGHLVLER